MVLPVNLSRYQTTCPSWGSLPPLQVGQLAGVILLLTAHAEVDCRVLFHCPLTPECKVSFLHDPLQSPSPELPCIRWSVGAFLGGY